jgi:hypothetical protein
LAFALKARESGMTIVANYFTGRAAQYLAEAESIEAVALQSPASKEAG